MEVEQQPNTRKRGGKKNKNKNKKGVRGNYTLDVVVKENTHFFEYCRQQKIVPDEEFSAFETALKTELPASFRIQRSLIEKDEFVNLLETKYFQPLRVLQNENEEIHCPEPIPFIPYAYQTNNSRTAIRSFELLSELHQFLISETATGAISRQEAVSMIPPLLLDIQPHHMVVDMCASPGSKTMQILELMTEKDKNSEGLLVANDVDNSRCYLLVHQTLKRLPTANCVVVNHDASSMPAPIDKDGNAMLFDRVLCDVVCSGDGTFRKNIEIWKNWDLNKGANLHKVQRSIASRSLELLKVGGLMAYSTCSLNPIEDEAILAYLLRTYKGAIELVDVSAQMPELKRHPGLSTWKVFNDKMKEYQSYNESQQAQERTICQTMFPPTKEEADEFHLDRSFRILPHAQNSGGFFVAIIRKTQEFNSKLIVDVPQKFQRVPAKKRRTVKEDPFIFLKAEEEAELKQEINDVYGISESFPFENLLVRNPNQDARRSLYFVNNSLREFMQNNSDRFKVINAGVSVMRKVDKVGCSSYRLAQDGLFALFPHINKRVIQIDLEDMKKVLKGSNEKHFVPLNELNNRDKFASLEPGSIVLQVEYKGFTKEICAWAGTSSVSAFVAREEKIHLLNIFGFDSRDLQNIVQTKRRDKAQKSRDAAYKAKESEMKDEVENSD